MKSIVHFWNRKLYTSPLRDKAFSITSNQGVLSHTTVTELESKQEEADTKMFLCAALASTIGFSSCNIVTIDSDVALLCLYFQHQLDVNIYLQMGTGIREKIFEIFSNDLSDDVLKALPSIHALSGCDSTSALVGIGKVKVYNAVCKNERFLDAAKMLGSHCILDEDVFKTLQELFCCLYGFKEETSINHCRHMAITSKQKMPDPEKIPPTRDALRQHIMRCSYQVKQWKKALDNEHIPDDPDGCGWESSNNGLDIKWMINKPDPDEVLEFTTCSCKKTSCSTNQCQCYALKLRCMDLCECRCCKNDEEEDDEESYDSESSDSESDSEIESDSDNANE
jgi:hypothetical protein